MVLPFYITHYYDFGDLITPHLCKNRAKPYRFSVKTKFSPPLCSVDYCHKQFSYFFTEAGVRTLINITFAPVSWLIKPRRP